MTTASAARSAARSAVARRPPGPGRRSSAVGDSSPTRDDLAEEVEGIEGVEDAGPETVAVRDPQFGPGRPARCHHEGPAHGVGDALVQAEAGPVVDADPVLAQQVQADGGPVRARHEGLGGPGREPLRQEEAHVGGVLGPVPPDRRDEDVDVLVVVDPVGAGVHAQAVPVHRAA